MICYKSSYKCTIIILDEATTINMTRVPKSALEEGSVAEYVCEIDSFNPDPTAVLWFVDDKPVNEYDAQIEMNSTSSVDYDGRTSESTLRLKTKREMNNGTVKCVLKNKSKKLKKHTLEVMCRYL